MPPDAPTPSRSRQAVVTRPWHRVALPLPTSARLDALGIILFAAAATWTVWSASIAGGAPVPTIAVMLGTAAALVIGRFAGRLGPWLVPSVVAGTILLMVIPFLPDVLTGRPGSGPLGYANANAALLLQAAIASLMIGWGSRSSAIRRAATAVAVGIWVVIVTSGSFAAGWLLSLPLLVASLPAVTTRTIRRSVAVCAAVLLVALGTTWIVAAVGEDAERRGPDEPLAAMVLGERRTVLWHTALVLMLEHPFVGVGPGKFAEAAGPAAADVDARHAHNEFLQQGAETGIMGPLLLVAVFLYGFARLWRVERPSRLTAFAATALAVLGVHANLDYILHFPAVPIASAALVGAGISVDARSPSRSVLEDDW